MRFAEMDITSDDSLTVKYKVNLSGVAGQLPTLIMFEDGVETLRFPPIDKTGRHARVLEYKEKDLLRYFDLDKRCLATRGPSKTAAKDGTKGRKQ